MSLPAVDPSLYLDSGPLAALKREAAANDPRALRAAAQQFEALFTSMVLKSMQKANFKDPLFGSDQQSFYQDMYDQQLAAQISKGPGLGLADMLVQQLRRDGLAGAGATGQSPADAPGASGTSSPSSGPATSPSMSADERAIHAAAVKSAPTTETAAGPASTGVTSSASTAASCGATSGQQLAFARSLWPQAQQAARQLGVSPVSLIAQAALETNWGRSLPQGADGASSNNLFGIKAGPRWSGNKVLSGTLEYNGGAASPVQAQFRSYENPGQCFRDYVALLKDNPRYAGALGTGSDVHAFASALQRGGYATDPDYASKLGAVATSLGHSLKLAAAQPMTAGSGAL